MLLALGIGPLETNPTRSYSPPLRPPVDRFRDVPAEGQPNAADSQGAPKAAPAAALDKREAGYYPGYDPNGARPKHPSGLDPPIMRGPDPPNRNCRMCNRDIPDPSKIEDCRICMKRACDICIPKATRLCPVCAMSIGSSQVPQHLFGTGGGGYSGHQDPNCTAATKCIPIDLPSEPEAAGLRVWIANMKEPVSNAYSYDGLYVISWLTEVEKAKSFDELNGECRYHVLEARFNAAIRKCIKTVAIMDKINRLTEAAQRANNRIKSRQILWLLYDRWRTANIGEQSFRIIELSNLRCSVSTFYAEEERLDRFIAKWDHILAGLDEPLTEQVKRSLFSEKVRHLRRSPFGDSHRPSRPPSDQRKKTGDTQVRIEEIDTIGIRTRGVRLAHLAKLQGGLGLRHPVLQQSMHAEISHVGGQECKFAHTRAGSSDAKRKERPPLIPGYCAQWISYGKCLRDKCDYKHAKPPEHLLKEAGQHTAAPAAESADAQPASAEPTSTADDRTYSPAPGLSAGEP